MDDLLRQLGEDVARQSWLDILAVLTGIIYVILAAHHRRICWVWGFISTVTVAYLSFTQYRLYADGALNSYYAVMAVVGWYAWGTDKDKAIGITRLSGRAVMHTMWLGVVGSLFLSALLMTYTDAHMARLDVLTSVFSVIATWWMVKRFVQGWWLWLGTNLAYVYLYVVSGATYLSMLMMVYSALSVYGLIHWRRRM